MSLGRHFATFMLAVILLSVAASSSFAARLLTATIEVDGKIVLKARLSDNGSSHPNLLWQRLGENLSWEEESPLPPQDRDPGRAQLKGEVVIRIRHVDNILVQENPTELNLVRNAAGTGWLIPIEELARIAPDRVIPRPPPLLKTSEIVGLSAFALVGATVLILGAWFILRRTGRSDPQNPSSS